VLSCHPLHGVPSFRFSLRDAPSSRVPPRPHARRRGRRRPRLVVPCRCCRGWPRRSMWGRGRVAHRRLLSDGPQGAERAPGPDPQARQAGRKRHDQPEPGHQRDSLVASSVAFEYHTMHMERSPVQPMLSRPRISALLRYFLCLGSLAFGGPVALHGARPRRAAWPVQPGGVSEVPGPLPAGPGPPRGSARHLPRLRPLRGARDNPGRAGLRPALLSHDGRPALLLRPVRRPGLEMQAAFYGVGASHRDHRPGGRAARPAHAPTGPSPGGDLRRNRGRDGLDGIRERPPLPALHGMAYWIVQAPPAFRRRTSTPYLSIGPLAVSWPSSSGSS
jgi:hypothetical protein